MQKDWFAIFKVKVTARPHMIKIWQLYCIFWTADPFATKLGLIVHYHKPECFMEKMDCCVQGQGHSKISKCQWMFVQMIFSELLNLLLPNLVLWCIIMSQIVFQKDWFAVFKVKVTVKDNIIKIWLFNILSELLILLQLNLVWWYIIIRWIVLWKDWIALLWSGQGHRKGSEFQWMFIWRVSPQLLNLLSPNLVWWGNIMGQSVMQEDWFAAFKFRVTVRAHLIRYDCFYCICWTADLLAAKFNWMVHHHKLECFVKN